MPRWKAILILILELSFLALGHVIAEQFDEELSIRTLLDGKVATRFQFKTILNGSTPRNPETLNIDDNSQHYTIFPLALGQILREYAVTELHLTLNAGSWNYDKWGYPEEPGVGSGAELWAWMGEGKVATVDHRWQGLRNALAGLFCASLGSLDEQRTTSPARSFMPEGSLPAWDLPHQIRHASLPSENVCTENLTPFLKLLPCKSLSGIATLLNPHRLFDADWHGMGVHVSWRPDEGVELRLSFQSVLDPLRSSSRMRRDWSLQSLFDRTIYKSCPVSQSSRITVSLPVNEMYNLLPNSHDLVGNLAVFDIKDGPDALNVAMQWLPNNPFEYPISLPDPPLVPLSIHRTLRGSTQAEGQLSIVIKNYNESPTQLLYLETMPWLLQLYLHTLRIYIDDIPRDDLISDIFYIPPIPHSRPSTFHSVLTLPPKSTFRLTIDVTKAFLRYTEHPPDAQRGWDLPPAIFVPLNSSSHETALARRIYTPALLVDLATPDFSMPYNVIIFSCSLIAFIFGSVFNLLTRKFVVVQLVDGGKEKLKST